MVVAASLRSLCRAASVSARPSPNDRFRLRIAGRGLDPLARGPVTTLQVNVGKVCNQACHHCHVEAGPKRTERMTPEVAERVIELMDSPGLQLVDVTGGAPELCDQFRPLVLAARRRGLRVIDRCNLTVLFEPTMAGLPEFLAEQRVDVTASLPCYGPDNVDGQRGLGVFEASIRALKLLNELGYGRGDGLRLDLVYNPGGAFLPPAQAGLEADYKRELYDRHGISFDNLLTITNMPIRRFAHSLERDGKYAEYMSLLVAHFNPATVAGLMCRSLVSVGYDGALYDCDFNQMLDMPMADSRPGLTIWDISDTTELSGLSIATADHCFGCTAGAGSSCGGALDGA